MTQESPSPAEHSHAVDTERTSVRGRHHLPVWGLKMTEMAEMMTLTSWFDMSVGDECDGDDD